MQELIYYLTKYIYQNHAGKKKNSFLIVTLIQVILFSGAIKILNNLSLNSLMYRHFTMSILHIGLIGFVLILIKSSFRNYFTNLISFKSNIHIYQAILSMFLGLSFGLLAINLGSLSIANMENYSALNAAYGKSFIIILFSCLLFPFLEEFLFRGIYCNHIQKESNSKNAIWFSAFLFYIAHINFETNLYFPNITILLFGAFLAYLYLKTERLITSVLVHASFNSSLMLGYFYMPKLMKDHGKALGEGFEGYIYTPYTITILVFCGITIPLIIFLLKKSFNKTNETSGG